jgi:NADPH2:quinone reductase
MRALICHDFTGINDLTVGELPDPQPLPGTALVRIEAAAVNFADSLVVAGNYQAEPDLPFAPGSEVAGVIEWVENMDGYSVGDRVCGFVGLTGAMAEMGVLFPNSLVRLPDSVSFETGAAIPVAYGTAYHALVDRADLEADDTLLVLGAAGGVGLAAVQVGKAIGSNVIAVVSSDEKETAVRGAGADEVIRHDQVPLRDGIRVATTGAGVDVVFDPVGGEMTELALRDTNWNGVLLVIGFTSGEIPKIPLNLNLIKGNSIAGVFFGRFMMEEPDKTTKNFEQIMQWIEEGELQPHVQKEFTLEEAAEAIRWVAERKVIGRVIVKP